VSLEGDEDSVFVPSIPPILNGYQRQLLMDELGRSTDEVHGIEHYILAKNFISSLQN